MYFEIYRTLFRRQWRWRLWAANGRIIANSGESYVNRADCENGIRLVKGSSGAEVREEAS